VPRGFTLIELLVVIIIIGILISIVFAIAGGVTERGRVTQTREIIRQLDMSLDSFTRETGDLPPPVVLAPNPDPLIDRPSAYAMADASYMSDFPDPGDRTTINTVGLYIAEAERQGLAELFTGLPQNRLRLFDPDQPNGGRQPELRTVFDAWGNPIRMVHPAFDGVINREVLQGLNEWDGTAGMEVDVFAPPNAMPMDLYVLEQNALPRGYEIPENNAGDVPIQRIRRVFEGDSGFCTNGRPYFYSVGKDGDPATTTDSNVYTTEPRFLTLPANP
jgi:prepilin-type N-terminal cleavage/methylation domain-containing protein